MASALRNRSAGPALYRCLGPVAIQIGVADIASGAASMRHVCMGAGIEAESRVGVVLINARALQVATTVRSIAGAKGIGAVALVGYRRG